jgi:uncharacterized protein YigE (DUF2233 family)
MADNFFTRVKNYVFQVDESSWKPVTSTDKDKTKNLSYSLSPVQIQRLRHDIQMWREACSEAERPLQFLPQRVKMQRMYLDVVIQGHTFACMQRRKSLTLLREYNFVNANGEPNEEINKLFAQKWFNEFCNYALDAQFYGYSLISLGDYINDAFPKVSIVRRANVSPDRLNVSPIPYSTTGPLFLEEPYKDWHVWVTTPTEHGITPCGFGLLYNVALYEIYCRNILGQNVTSAELYGMPTRVGKTTKTEESERRELQAALSDMGSAGYILLDMMDEVELMESSQTGAAYKIFQDLEMRLEKKVSKIILGHADAMDSTPGKLGGTDGEKGAAALAMRDIQSIDGAFIEDIINGSLLPKMRNLGANIPEDVKFEFANNIEEQEERDYQIGFAKKAADLALTMSQAGLTMDAKYFEEVTQVPTTKTATPEQVVVNRVKNKLTELYK